LWKIKSALILLMHGTNMKNNKLLFRLVNSDLYRRTLPPEEGNALLPEGSVVLGIRVQDEVQKASSCQCNVPSSEPFITQ
jgi:hypothetical protein